MLAVHCARGYFGPEKNVGRPVQANCWLAENALNEGHGFTGCGKLHVLYQGTTLEAAEKVRSERESNSSRD